jgi:hypothetical protein
VFDDEGPAAVDSFDKVNKSRAINALRVLFKIFVCSAEYRPDERESERATAFFHPQVRGAQWHNGDCSWRVCVRCGRWCNEPICHYARARTSKCERVESGALTSIFHSADSIVTDAQAVPLAEMDGDIIILINNTRAHVNI